jgi:Zn-dependent protease with chaperone function
MLRGTYSDGKTATRWEVDLTIATERGRKLLRVSAPGVFAEWDIASVERLDGGDGSELRFRYDGGDARLAIPSEYQHELKSLAPQLFSTKRRNLAIAGIAGLVAIAAATTGLVFFGAPVLSGPIARATPTHVETTLGRNTGQILSFITDTCGTHGLAQKEAEDLVRRLGEASGSPFDSSLTFVDADFANAFALPGGSIMVTDDLIDMLETPDQLAGVLAHETAHVARRHVMAAIVRELGGAMILDLLVGGGSGAGQQIALSGLQLQSLRHGRNAEADADELAIDYLIEIGVDPEALAEFFDRIGEITDDDNDQPGMAELLLSHPSPARRARESRERAEIARAAAHGELRPAMSADAWDMLKQGCT